MKSQHRLRPHGWLAFLGLMCLPMLCASEPAGDVVITAPVEARNTNDTVPKHEGDLVDGLILNRAMTRFGHRFYREFVSAYRDMGGMTDHSGLTIVEQATARSGSKITILHNRKPIFITVVSPASRNLDLQASAAAVKVDMLLKQSKKQANWLSISDPDLAPDEF